MFTKLAVPEMIRYGYDKRFGIVRVDYATQQRTVKDSGTAYARVIAARALGEGPTGA